MRKIQTVKNFKNVNCDKTQKVTKPKILNYDKTKKSPIVKKLKKKTLSNIKQIFSFKQNITM